jgi:hypothetical protein
MFLYYLSMKLACVNFDIKHRDLKCNVLVNRRTLWGSAFRLCNEFALLNALNVKTPT